TGVEEMSEASVNVYPNPFTNKLIVDAHEMWPDKTEFRLYNDAGRLVHFATVAELAYTNGKYIYSEGTVGHGFSQLPHGQYILVIVHDEIVGRALVQKH
ncbi:MAG: T9SS type A sorting domain-containing protein, partial [Flavobacteriales bacterium]|nr:T9SS type A sorting domain-containing protein [Flavobacteriales bacterium]